MGFFSGLKAKAKSIWADAKDAWHETTEAARELWHEVKETTREICQNVSDRYQEWKKRKKERHATERVKETYHDYVPPKADKPLIDKSKQYIRQKFGDSIQDTLQDMSPMERVNTFREVVQEVSNIFDVPLNNIDFFQPELGHESMCGFYNRVENSLNLNANMIVCDNMDLVEEQVYTVFHEMKHARQWAAVQAAKNGKLAYGYDAETVLEWAENFDNYISPEEDDEEYRKQPLERDTFGLEGILKGDVTEEELIKAKNYNY